MKAEEIFNEENKAFFRRKEEYENKYTRTDDDGNIIKAIMPHKGFNFSASYDAIECAMDKYAEYKRQELLKELIGEIEKMKGYHDYASLDSQETLKSVIKQLDNKLNGK